MEIETPSISSPTSGRADLMQWLLLIDALPEIFRRQKGFCRFAAIDDENTYVIECLRHPNGTFSFDGFSLRIIARHEPRYVEHRFEICPYSNGIAIGRALSQFNQALRGMELASGLELHLSDLKRNVRQALPTANLVDLETFYGPGGVVRDALKYVLSRLDIWGEVKVILADRPWFHAGPDILRLSPLPFPLDELKPTVGLAATLDELRAVNVASFRLTIPPLNVVDEMKAISALLERGLSEDAIEGLATVVATVV